VSILCMLYWTLILVVVERPSVVHGHNNNLHVQNLLGRRKRDPQVVTDCLQ